MGFGSASREEKLKMMKTKRTKKLTKKLNKLGKKKVLSRGIIDQFNAIKSEKSKDSRKRATNIEDDWMADRDTHFNEEEEDVLPLDMLDADIDWANSAFAGMKRRHDEKDNTEQSDDDLETKKRKFKGQLDENLEEMLPIKLQDGRLLRPTREKAVEEGEEAADDLEETKEEWKPEDFSALSASELLAKRKQLLQEAKERISTVSGLLLANPQENVMKLRDLYQLCQGFQVHPLVRENVQKIAMVSTVQVLIDVIPGYAIRPLTDAERQQKQKKETKKLVAFEESLLRYYLKFLQLCEKLAGKFMGKNRQVDEETFTYKVGMISVKALARLATSCAHFNYTTNIVSTLVRLSLCKNQVILKEICDALSALFKEDVHLQMSLFGARSIATLVTKRKGRVPPQLLETFLHLNIREVKNNDKKSGKGKIFAKRALIKKEKANKSARKYKKQLDKLEADLKELDAQESISAKLKNATEAMKYVFQTYFSILKRMPNLELLSPCLEGLSKFAHLLGVEFFDDLILTMEQLVDREHLRIVDQLHCVHTVFVMLTGEGQLLNVDPSKFYRSVYRIINAVPFETKYVWDRGSISEMSQVYSLVINMFIPENRTKQLTMLCRALDAMINERRKQVPLQRVAAFTKRLLCVASVMDDRSAACILALVRSFFIAHPKILSMTEADDEGGSGTYGGIFRADINDPDVCNALGAGVRQELRLLAKRRFKPVHQIANNILHGVPSTGQMRLNPEFNVKPAILLDYSDNTEQSDHEKVDMKYLDQIRDYCKKRQFELTAENAQFHILHWLEAK